jgi:SAM-dependent methyltransferase
VERGEYERLDASEERMWWFRALHRNLIRIWSATAPAGAGDGRSPRLLDAGCGTGGLLARLGASGGAFRAGIDRDDLACRFARGKAGAAIVQGTIDALPFAAMAFDAVFSADVLCHSGVDQQAALLEMRRCLRPGGVLVLNLPAYRWLFSAHDRAVDNARRYARDEVARLMEAAGFVRIRTSYWNTLLFPLMVARRKLAAADASDVALLPQPLEWLLAAVAAGESRLLGRLFAWGLRLPFGGSILAAGVKP